MPPFVCYYLVFSGVCKFAFVPFVIHKKMTHRTRLYFSLAFIILFLIGWGLFFHYYSVESLIRAIGIQNVYLVAFLLAIVGGFSSITGFSLYAALATFAHGGVSPYVLGAVAGLGIFLSDTLFYFLLFKMKALTTSIQKRSHGLIEKMWRFMYKTPSWIVFFCIYLYAGFAPVPNDLLLVVLVLSGYQYKEFAPFLFLGDLTAMILLTTVAAATAG